MLFPHKCDYGDVRGAGCFRWFRKEDERGDEEICKSQSISNLPLSLEGKVMFSAHFVSAVEFCSRFCLGKKATLELIALGFGGTVVLSDVQSHMSNCSVGY